MFGILSPMILWDAGLLLLLSRGYMLTLGIGCFTLMVR